MTSLNRSFGATEFPLLTHAESEIDPAWEIMLELFGAAINAELAGGWSTAVTGTPLAGRDPVQTMHPGQPDPQLLQQVALPFPVLFVAPGEGSVDEHTMWEERITQKWAIDYVLGTLDAGDAKRANRILRAVLKVIALTIREGGHKAYATQTLGSGIVQARRALGPGADTANFSTVNLKDFRIGPARFEGSQNDGAPAYWACGMTLETTELDGFVDGTEADFAGASYTVGTGDVAGVIPNLIEADTAIPLP